MVKQFKRSVRNPLKLDYTTRLHWKRRVERIDYRFVLAVLAIAGGVAAATRII